MSTAQRVKPENLADVINDMEGGLMEELSGRDKSFMNDLINGKYGFRARGYLSDAQIKWVDIFYKRALGVEPEKAAPESVGDLADFVKFFTDAKANLKYPKVKMVVNDNPLKFHLAGPNSKYKGSIMITDGGPYGSNKWYGVVTPEGEWTPSKQVTDDLRTIITRVLKSFSEDPANAAMTYGKMQSSCCFCAKPLDTKESVSAGYGPVCADKWGLPWGHVS